MKCVMCNYSSGGVMISGINASYKICNKCLLKYTKDLKVMVLPSNNDIQNKLFKTRQRKAYIQEEVDKKLNRYLLEV